ncbi:MAG TPA: Rieske 2Fe-2S domain-containing protein [Candidatus Limnocylindria bacterium]|nr:Rieske 2Fe-2S domain-containing protein [Candidatus Limnocylindria bacterium]
MGQYEQHVFVCTSGETCPEQGDTEKFVKILRERAKQMGRSGDMRVNKAGCFSQCGRGPMIVFYPDDVWYAGVQESDLDEIVTSHIVAGRPVERLRYNPGKPGANKVSEAELADIKRAAAGRAQARPPGDPAPAWKRVGPAAEVPANGMKEFSVEGVNVLIVHTGDAYVALQALCPHETIPLEQGMHDGSVLTCLEHMWQFDIKTGAPRGDALEGLRSYPLKVDSGDLYVVV